VSQQYFILPVVICACRFDIVLGPNTFNCVKIYTLMAQYSLWKITSRNVWTTLSDASQLLDLLFIITQQFCTEIAYPQCLCKTCPLLPISVTTLSKAWFFSRSLAAIAGSNPTGRMDVCLLWVLSDIGICVGLITRLEESYRVWCVGMRSWSLENKEVLAHWEGGGCRAMGQKVLVLK